MTRTALYYHCERSLTPRKYAMLFLSVAVTNIQQTDGLLCIEERMQSVTHSSPDSKRCSIREFRSLTCDMFFIKATL